MNRLLESALESYPELRGKRIELMRSNRIAYFGGYAVDRKPVRILQPLALMAIFIIGASSRFGLWGIPVGVGLSLLLLVPAALWLNPNLWLVHVAWLKKLDALVVLRKDYDGDKESFVLFHELAHISNPSQSEEECDLVAAQKLGWTLEQLLAHQREWREEADRVRKHK